MGLVLFPDAVAAAHDIASLNGHALRHGHARKVGDWVPGESQASDFFAGSCRRRVHDWRASQKNSSSRCGWLVPMYARKARGARNHRLATGPPHIAARWRECSCCSCRSLRASIWQKAEYGRTQKDTPHHMEHKSTTKTQQKHNKSTRTQLPSLCLLRPLLERREHVRGRGLGPPVVLGALGTEPVPQAILAICLRDERQRERERERGREGEREKETRLALLAVIQSCAAMRTSNLTRHCKLQPSPCTAVLTSKIWNDGRLLHATFPG